MLANNELKTKIIIFVISISAMGAFAQNIVANHFHEKSDSDCSFYAVVNAQLANICVGGSIMHDNDSTYNIDNYDSYDCMGSITSSFERQYDLCADYEDTGDMEEFNNPHIKFTYHTSWPDLHDSIAPGTYAVENFYNSETTSFPSECPTGTEVARSYHALDVCLDGREAFYEIGEDIIVLKECSGNGRPPLNYNNKECTFLKGNTYSKWTIEEIELKSGAEEFKEGASEFWDDNMGIIIGLIAGIVGLTVIGCVVRTFILRK